MSDTEQDHAIIGWAVEIVSSYISNNAVPAGDVPGLLDSVHASLTRIAGQPEEAVKQPLTPPVPIRKSIADEYLICLEDGKRFKSLKRHLQTVHGLSPEQYRDRWGLNRDYPMVAPAYAKARSALAKGMGLGASRRPAVADDPVEEIEDIEELPAPVVAPAPSPEPEQKAPRKRTKKTSA